MGAMADAIVKYTQPLIDATDGSPEQLRRAVTLGQICWNLALLPQDKRDDLLAELQPSLGVSEEEFQGFRQSLVGPMIRRHKEMFPLMHQRGAPAPSTSAPTQALRSARIEKYPGTGRNEPCPCQSGQKYKRCCGR
jgi:hypothetical protein